MPNAKGGLSHAGALSQFMGTPQPARQPLMPSMRLVQCFPRGCAGAIIVGEMSFTSDRRVTSAQLRRNAYSSHFAWKRRLASVQRLLPSSQRRWVVRGSSCSKLQIRSAREQTLARNRSAARQSGTANVSASSKRATRSSICAAACSTRASRSTAPPTLSESPLPAAPSGTGAGFTLGRAALAAARSAAFFGASVSFSCAPFRSRTSSAAACGHLSSVGGWASAGAPGVTLSGRGSGPEGVTPVGASFAGA